MKKNVSALFVLFCLMWQLSAAQIPQLWGATFYGGKYRDGNIYKINGDGSNFDTVFSFNESNGANPENDMLQASNGKLYGLTSELSGGGYGTMFSINPLTDSFKNIYTFLTGTTGSLPQSNIIQLSNGLIYGMTT